MLNGDSATSSWPERDSSDEAADTTNSAFHLLPSTSVPLTKQTHDSPKFHHAWRECLNLPTTHSRIIFPYQRQSPLSTLDVFTDEPVASHAVGSAFTSVENILESSLTPTLHHRTCRTTVICRPWSRHPTPMPTSLSFSSSWLAWITTSRTTASQRALYVDSFCYIVPSGQSNTTTEPIATGRSGAARSATATASTSGLLNKSQLSRRWPGFPVPRSV